MPPPEFSASIYQKLSTVKVDRAPDAAQRAVLHGVVRCRAGAVTNSGVWYGPGSAKRHEECRIAPGTRASPLRAQLRPVELFLQPMKRVVADIFRLPQRQDRLPRRGDSAAAQRIGGKL